MGNERSPWLRHLTENTDNEIRGGWKAFPYIFAIFILTSGGRQGSLHSILSDVGGGPDFGVGAGGFHFLRAEGEFEFAFLDRPLAVFVYESEVGCRDCEIYCLAFARFEGDFVEATHFQHVGGD